MRISFVVLLSCIVLSACSPRHSSEYYKTHHADLAKTLQECLFNGKAGGDCKAAAEANATNVAAQRAKAERDYQSFHAEGVAAAAAAEASAGTGKK